jgi:hypothetical protein
MWSNRQELHDAEAERARQHLPEPTMPWRAPGARVVAVGGLPGDRVGGAVSVGSLFSSSFLIVPLAVLSFTYTKRVPLPLTGPLGPRQVMCGCPRPSVRRRPPYAIPPDMVHQPLFTSMFTKGVHQPRSPQSLVHHFGSPLWCTTLVHQFSESNCNRGEAKVLVVPQHVFVIRGELQRRHPRTPCRATRCCCDTQKSPTSPRPP